jgi:hypothetical protein
LDEVERREFELADARWDAEDAVLNAQPHSPAGLFDLIMFMAEYIAEDTMTDICKIVPVFVNAAKAMRAIAGDARPVTISKGLQEVGRRTRLRGNHRQHFGKCLGLTIPTR